MLLMVLGIGTLGATAHALPPERQRFLAVPGPWWLLMGLLGALILRPAIAAILRPGPAAVQRAVRVAIWSVIILDAALAALVAPPSWPLLILVLLLPTVWLGRWFYAT